MHPFIYKWTLIQNQGLVQTQLYCHYQWVQPRLLPQRSPLYRRGAHTRALLNLEGLFADIKTIDTNLIDIDKNRDARTSRNTPRGRSLSCFDSAELGKMTQCQEWQKRRTSASKLTKGDKKYYSTVKPPIWRMICYTQYPFIYVYMKYILTDCRATGRCFKDED